MQRQIFITGVVIFCTEERRCWFHRIEIIIFPSYDLCILIIERKIWVMCLSEPVRVRCPHDLEGVN